MEGDEGVRLSSLPPISLLFARQPQRPEYIYLLLLLYPPMPRSTSCEFVPPPIQPVLNTQHPPPPPPLSVPPPPMPDLPSSPRKTVSSVSANARSQTQKKPGAPKPKGAVRAKSGCYTCRIRRKVCIRALLPPQRVPFVPPSPPIINIPLSFPTSVAVSHTTPPSTEMR